MYSRLRLNDKSMYCYTVFLLLYIKQRVKILYKRFSPFVIIEDLYLQTFLHSLTKSCSNNSLLVKRTQPKLKFLGINYENNDFNPDNIPLFFIPAICLRVSPFL